MNRVQNFWEVLEGGEGRTEWALDRMGLAHLAQEKAVVLSMGQVQFLTFLCCRFMLANFEFVNSDIYYFRQKKRLQLARMLAVPRPLWLLDEPSVGLDTEVVTAPRITCLQRHILHAFRLF